MCNSNAYRVLGKRLNRSQGTNPRNKIGITTSVVKCKSCGLIYSNPQPIPESLQDHYGIPPEEYWRADYFKMDDRYFHGEIKTLKSLRSFKVGDKALDIGAGLGKCMIALTQAGFDTYGIEPSQPFYERAIQKMNIGIDKLKPTAIEESEFPDNYFEFITFGAVLEHLYDPGSSIVKSLTWLKPGGVVHIEVPSSDWLINKILNIYYKIKGLDYVANISPMHEPFHLYEFSLKSFQEHAKENNYQIIHHEYYVAQTYMPKILDTVLVPFMQFSNTGMQLSVWLKKN
jgi:2-polyprenyl-3-methyl-5-hydroxy-6-metoxy-1,4-benzoquinol methylase